MNIYTYLKQDHEKVASLFKQIIATENISEREDFFAELQQELTIHADAENATFYKELKKHPETKELIQHATKEHNEVKDFLASLEDMEAGSSEWLVQLGELKHSVEHHVEEEEKKIFKEARKVLTKEIEKDLLEKIEAFKEKNAG
jgi:hypothetical protein